MVELELSLEVHKIVLDPHHHTHLLMVEMVERLAVEAVRAIILLIVPTLKLLQVTEVLVE